MHFVWPFVFARNFDICLNLSQSLSATVEFCFHDNIILLKGGRGGGGGGGLALASQ